MAEEKFTIVDLRKALTKQTGIEEAQVNAFLNQLIAAIKEGLKKDKQVRISGLGTFKLLWVEPRKSVNISTGEPIVIEGYQKLTFTPEPSVKERINEPYADLVPVELDAEGNPIETQEKPKSDRMQRFDEQALEIKDLLADLGAEMDIAIPAEDTHTEEITAEETAEEAIAKEEQTQETIAEEPEIHDNEIDKAIEAAVATVAAVREIPKEPLEDDALPEDNPAVEPKEETANPEAEENKEESKKEKDKITEDKPKKPFHGWLAALITVAVILIILVAAFFFFQMKTLEFIDKISERINGKEQIANTVESADILPETISVDTCMADSLSADMTAEKPEITEKVETTEKVEIAEKPEQTETAEQKAITQSLFNSDFYKERNYTEFIGMETVKEGSRLTWIAKKYYGSKDLWVFIYEANKEKIKKPSNVVVGTQLQIPALPEEIIKMESPKAQNFVKGLQDKYLNK